MLTRRQVAARLGKSIATVRRLEGVHLHPHRDTRGVRRFSPSEVERFAAALARGRVRRAGAPRSADWKGWLTRRLARPRSGRPKLALAAYRRRQNGLATERELAELRRCTNLLAELLLEVTTPAQRRHLGPDFVRTLIELAVHSMGE